MDLDLVLVAMNGENRPLATDELVWFKIQGKLLDQFLGMYGNRPQINKEKPKDHDLQCNHLDLETLGNTRISPPYTAWL
jgi:hypothetical protein